MEAVRAMIIELHVHAVAQKNIGYLYVSRTLQALGIDPAHGIVMDKKLASDMVRKSKKEFKVRSSGVTTMGSDRENPGAPNLNGPNGGPQV
jgi:hypothetical protein